MSGLDMRQIKCICEGLIPTFAISGDHAFTFCHNHLSAKAAPAACRELTYLLKTDSNSPTYQAVLEIKDAGAWKETHVHTQLLGLKLRA